jgi:molybdate transport system regulatory protein
VRHKVWLDAGRRFALGDGGVDLLRASEATGSIRAAARHVGWSYRHTLVYLDNSEAALGHPLVERTRGGNDRGGAQLTPAGRHFLPRYTVFRRQLDAALAQLSQVALASCEAVRFGGNAYDRSELAGAFGDLGTLSFFLVGYITIARVDPTGVTDCPSVLKSRPSIDSAQGDSPTRP